MVRKKVKGKDSEQFFDDIFKKGVLIILGIFVVCIFFLMSSLSPEITGAATTNVEVRVPDTIKIVIDKVGGVGGMGWIEGSLNPNVAKVLLWLTLLLIIYGALQFAGIPSQEGIFLKLLLSTLVSLMAVAYVTPAEILAIYSSYSAMGLAIGVIIPFVVLILASAMLLSFRPKATGYGAAGRILIELMLWVGFVVILAVKIAFGWFVVINGIRPAPYILLAMAIILTMSVLIVAYNKKFRKWMHKLGLEIIERRAETIGKIMEGQKEIQTSTYPSGKDWERLMGQ